MSPNRPNPQAYIVSDLFDGVTSYTIPDYQRTLPVVR